MLIYATTTFSINNMTNTPDNTHSNSALITNWLSLAKINGQISRAIDIKTRREYGLTLADSLIIIHLARKDCGTMRQNELSALVGLTKSGMTRSINRMIETGLLERRACAEDKRGAFACVTEEGRRTSRRLEVIHLEAIQPYAEIIALINNQQP
jgi:DNA-binding MarR family transcriptional regulator